jgi:hypothetical protein
MLNRGHTLIALLLLAIVAGVALGCSPPPSLGVRLVPGREVSQKVWGKRLDFTYEGKAGEVITLRVISKTQGLDPWVQLFDPEGREEASDDDGGGKGNPLIASHALRRSGQYTVGVGSAGGRSGELSVLLVRIP